MKRSITKSTVELPGGARITAYFSEMVKEGQVFAIDKDTASQLDSVITLENLWESMENQDSTLLPPPPPPSDWWKPIDARNIRTIDDAIKERKRLRVIGMNATPGRRVCAE